MDRKMILYKGTVFKSCFRFTILGLVFLLLLHSESFPASKPPGRIGWPQTTNLPKVMPPVGKRSPALTPALWA